MALHLDHMHGAIAAVRAAAGDVGIAAALIRRRRAGAGDELEAGLVINAEAVRHMLPVRAPDDEGLAVFPAILCCGTSSTPEGPEMDVLHAAHIEAVINEQSTMQRCGIEIADEMPPRVPPKSTA